MKLKEGANILKKVKEIRGNPNKLRGYKEAYINEGFHITEISYRELWRMSVSNYLAHLNALNDKYMSISKFILKSINLKTNKLRMNNREIAENMNNIIKTQLYPMHISTQAVSRTISRLEKIIIVKNGLPFLARKRYGKYGRKSYLKLNKEILPKSNAYNSRVLIVYKKVKLNKRKREKMRHRKMQMRLKLHQIDIYQKKFNKLINIKRCKITSYIRQLDDFLR